MKWYVVNIQTGGEQKAKLFIDKALSENPSMKGSFEEIVLPSMDEVRMVRGKKQIRSKISMPGYLFVKMDMNDTTWRFIRDSLKVTGFLGGQRPKPVPESQVETMLNQGDSASGGSIKLNVVAGEEIKIIDGPFKGFTGKVDEVHEDREKVKVLVSIFGRPTPVELDYSQLESL